MTTARSSIKLPSTTSTPNTDALTNMLSTSRNQGQVAVILTILRSESDCSFSLTVSWVDDTRAAFGARDQRAAVPTWSLNRENIITKQQQKIWVHKTNDVQLVQTLLENEFASHSKNNGTKAPGDSFTSGNGNDFGRAVENTPALITYGEMSQQIASTQEQTPYDSGAQLNFTGNLTAMDVANLLQSLNICSVSGRLEITEKLDEVHIFFEEGLPTHARRARGAMGSESIESIGDTVVVEVLTWQKGEYQFVPSLKSRERTIKKKLPTLLMEGVTLRDQVAYLRSIGVEEDSALVRVNPNLSEREFEAKASSGAPLDMTQQKWLYQQFDGGRSVIDIANRHDLEKTRWVPLLYNLVSCELLKPANQLASVSNGAASKNTFVLDAVAVEKAGAELARSESGFLSFPLFIHMVKTECARALDTRVPFSLVLFELNRKTERGLDPLSNVELRELAHRLDSAKASYEWMGHFETLDFGIVLPGKTVEQANDLAQTILQIASSEPLDPDAPKSELHFSFGIASIPQDGLELTEIVNAACRRKAEKKKR